MRVRILTPLSVVMDRADIAQLAARDDSGAFAIRPGHAPLVTALPPTVLRLTLADETTLFAALAGGMLRVDRDGVVVTSLDAAIGADLAPLAERVRADRTAAAALRAEGRATENKLNAALVHHLLDSVAADREGGQA